MTKSIKTIRSSVRHYRQSEAYAQYLYRENKAASFETWLEFMGNFNNRKKISKPLMIINGGLA